jgi:hypothetical protein
MNMAQTSIVECHACQELAVAHTVAGLEIFTVGHRLTQVFSDQLDSLLGTCVGHWRRNRRNIGFDRMRQSIHTGGSRQSGRHSDHQQGIIDGNARRDAPVDNCHFHFA